jgi:hypothetical protein
MPDKQDKTTSASAKETSASAKDTAASAKSTAEKAENDKRAEGQTATSETNTPDDAASRDKQAEEPAAKDTQRDRAEESSSAQPTDSVSTDDEAETHSQPEPPEGNAPGAEPPEQPVIGIVDNRVHLKPADRGTYVGPPVARNADVDIPDEFVSLPEETEELTGTPVDVFQVIASSGAVALRLDGEVYVFNREQSRALGNEASGALGNVVS